jgi:hypothetical protein
MSIMQQSVKVPKSVALADPVKDAANTGKPNPLRNSPRSLATLSVTHGWTSEQ